MTAQTNVPLVFPAPHDLAIAAESDWMAYSLHMTTSVAGDFFTDGKFRRALAAPAADALAQCLTRHTRRHLLSWPATPDQQSVLLPCTMAALALTPTNSAALQRALRADTELLHPLLGFNLGLTPQQRRALLRQLAPTNTDVAWWLLWYQTIVRPHLPEVQPDPALQAVGITAWVVASVPFVSGAAAVQWRAQTGLDVGGSTTAYYLDRLVCLMVTFDAKPRALERSLTQQVYLEQLAGTLGVCHAAGVGAEFAAEATVQIVALAAMTRAVLLHDVPPVLRLTAADVDPAPVLASTTGHARALLDCFLVVPPSLLAGPDPRLQGAIVKRDQAFRQAYGQPNDRVPVTLDYPLETRFRALFGWTPDPTDPHLAVLAKWLDLNRLLPAL